MAVAEVPSTMRTPRGSRARARPTARAAGWTAAQWGVKVAPRTDVAPTMAVASAASSQRSSSVPKPRDLASATSSVARLAWAAERARTTVPPLAKSQEMPSASAARSISSIDWFIAARIARAASTPSSRAMRASWAAKRADAHPPLRPEAPKPQTSASMMTIRSVGLTSRSERAVHRPVNPPPTMATSTSRSPDSEGRCGTSVPRVSHHSEIPAVRGIMSGPPRFSSGRG